MGEARSKFHPVNTYTVGVVVHAWCEWPDSARRKTFRMTNTDRALLLKGSLQHLQTLWNRGARVFFAFKFQRHVAAKVVLIK